MKKLFIFFGSFMLIFASVLNSGDISFKDFRDLIKKDILPAGFILNKSRTRDMKSGYRVQYDGDRSKMEMISFWFLKGVEEFNEFDKTGDPEIYTWQERSVIYTDGKKAGMAGIIVILKNKKGKLGIHHRVFGGKFLGKSDMEKLLIKIGLEKMEK